MGGIRCYNTETMEAFPLEVSKTDVEYPLSNVKKKDKEIDMNLVPAYGRDYKSQKAVKEDLDGNKDFQIQDISSRWNGSFVNKEQLIEHGIGRVTIRYKKLASVAVIRVTA